MGIVYLARHPVSRQRVALKVILPQQATPQAIQDFLQEIRLLARFNHPGIATIFDADTFESEDGRRPYFTMQFIEGAKPVTDYARDARCPLERRLELIEQTASAVAAAHELKVVHGDIKPKNVLVGLAGEVRVVDFGAALDAARPEAGLRAFTLTYAAPEQRNERRAVLQSDVYALAVLAYEVLTGRRPFAEGDAAGVDGEPLPIRKLNRKVSTKIEKVLRHALSKHPEARYPDAGAFRGDFAAAQRGDVLSIERRTIWKVTRAFCTMHWRPVLAGGLVLATLLLGLAGTTWQSINARRFARRERQASELNERLKRSTARALTFVGKFLHSIDPYQSQGQTPDVNYLLNAANNSLSEIADDHRALAMVLGILGKIASNVDRFDMATNHLSRSVELWAGLARDDRDGREAQDSARREQAKVLNALAWAELGDQRQSQGLAARAARAVQPAREAYLIRLQRDGPTHDDTVCFQADWLRMRQLVGDEFGATTNFLGLLAALAHQELPAFLFALRDTLAETARLAGAGQEVAARQRVRAFLEPFLSPERPRFRARVPLALAQAAEGLSSLDPLSRLFIGLGESRTQPLRVCVAEVALELVREIRPGNVEEEKRVRGVVDRIKHETPAK